MLEGSLGEHRPKNEAPPGFKAGHRRPGHMWAAPFFVGVSAAARLSSLCPLFPQCRLPGLDPPLEGHPHSHVVGSCLSGHREPSRPARHLSTSRGSSRVGLQLTLSHSLSHAWYSPTPGTALCLAVTQRRAGIRPAH